MEGNRITLWKFSNRLMFFLAIEFGVSPLTGVGVLFRFNDHLLGKGNDRPGCSRNSSINIFVIFWFRLLLCSGSFVHKGIKKRKEYTE